jgi:DNA-binding CsgD family transcriptional regulator
VSGIATSLTVLSRAGVRAAPQAQVEPVLGRSKEIAALRAFLDRPRTDQARSDQAGTGPGVLWLLGEGGIGKTTVLSLGCRLAARAGMDVVRLEGRSVPHHPGAVVEQLVRATQTASSNDPPRTTTSPAAVTGLDRLRLSHVLIEALGAAIELRPLLLAIDDVDVVDRPSQECLAFALRGLTGGRLSVLLSSRECPRPQLGSLDATHHVIEPLVPQASADLVHRQLPSLVSPVVDRLCAEAWGNPLALVELPKALTAPQRRGEHPLPTPLRLTSPLRRVFGDGLDHLSARAQELLVLAALERTGDLGVIRAAHAGSHDVEHLDQAEDLGLVEVRDGGRTLLFTHPLVRAAVLERAGTPSVRAARRALAAAVAEDPERHAWQVADGLVGADDEVADLLESAAHHAADRGDPAAAANAESRAAELTSDADRRGARLMQAAYLRASATGELSAAARLLSEATSVSPGVHATLRAAATAAQLLQAGETPLEAIHRLLADTIEAFPPSKDDGRDGGDVTSLEADLVDAFGHLFDVSFQAARVDLWRRYTELATRFEPRLRPTLRLRTQVLPDLTRAPQQVVDELGAQLRRLSTARNATEVVEVGTVALHLDRLAECRTPLLRIAEDASRGGPATPAVRALMLLSIDDALTGQLEQATSRAHAGLELARALSQNQPLWGFELVLSLTAAFTGRLGDVETLTEQMLAWAQPRGALLVEQYVHYARGLASLGTGEAEDAYLHFTAINSAGRLTPFSDLAMWSAFDLVDAAVHTGRHPDAIAHATALTDSGVARLSPRLAFRVAAASALTATDRLAVPRFEATLALSGCERWPFERARVHLAYGARLRRLRRSEAKGHLVTAYEIFRRLDMPTWARMAAQQMRAEGFPLLAELRPRPPQLGARDRQIATLAAAGLSNREIGARLYLSPRTVGSRLYRIFPQLGITSRAALRDALDSLPEPNPDPSSGQV